MFSRTLWIAFLTISLSSFAVQGAPLAQDERHQNCSAAPAKTIVRTVTVTARADPTPSKGTTIKVTSTKATSVKATSTGLPNAGDAVSTTETRAATTTTVKNGNNSSTRTTSIAVTSTGKPRGGGDNGSTKTTSVAVTSTGKPLDGTNDSTKTTSVAVTSTEKPRGGNGASTTKTRAAIATTLKNGDTASSSASAPASTATTPATGNGNQNDNADPQRSLTLDPRVIASSFANDGQDVPTAGQVASLTSTNNFINFCLTVPDLPITDGKQITTGSCNPSPIGAIPSTDNMPSAKFAFPANFGTVKANTEFTIKMNIQNLETGFFVNAQESYFAAPQQLNGQGQIKGHSHVVVEQLESLQQTTPTDPRKFAFFKGLNAGAKGGALTADVTNGLPAGFYKLSSINTAANHQPAIVAVAQHGSLDDSIYFTVTEDGNPLPDANAAGNDASATAPAEASSASAADNTATQSVAGKGVTATASATSSEAPAATGEGGNNSTSSEAAATVTAKGTATVSPKETATASAKETASVDPGKGGKETASASATETAAAGGKATATVDVKETAAAGGKGNAAAGGKKTASEKAGAQVTSSEAASAAPTEATGGPNGGFRGSGDQ